MRHTRIYKAWARILLGHRPALAVELTNKCPLSCPGCYAYQPEHVTGAPLETIPDYQGNDLVNRVLNLLDDKRPQGLFLVGGEPLVRIRELRELLPKVSARGIEAEVVTSGVIPIPPEWMDLEGISVVVSIDGLQPEHDRRREPATYERILRNIEGCRVIVHCTITSQMAAKPSSLEEFLRFWSPRPEVEGIRMSIYTPQVGETSSEILTEGERDLVVSTLGRLGKSFGKLRLSDDMLAAYRNPPQSPDDCIFAKVTECLSADLESPVVPCQLGGQPDCSQCGCVAAVGLQAVGFYRFPGGLRVSDVFKGSFRIGSFIRAARRKLGHVQNSTGK